MTTLPFDWTPEMIAQREWDNAHMDAKGFVQHPDVEVSSTYPIPMGRKMAMCEEIDQLKARRSQRDGPFINNVEKAKILPWLFKYRVGSPGKRGWWPVLWCPKRHSGERLLMRLHDKYNLVLRSQMRLQQWQFNWELKRRGDEDE